MPASVVLKLIASVKRYHFCEIAGKTIIATQNNYDGLFLTFVDGYCKVKASVDQYDECIRYDLNAVANAFELISTGFITQAEYDAAKAEDDKVTAAVRKRCEEDDARQLIKRLGAKRIRELLG